MLKFLLGVVVGIYIAQEYKDKVPQIKELLLNILDAAKKNNGNQKDEELDKRR
jgi:hypothetical protein